MGWTETVPRFYKNGKIDRKKEMDTRWTQTEHNGYPELKVLKSSMIGNVYYAAIQVTRTQNKKEQYVFANIALTSERDGWFGYKDMSETMNPYNYDCPKGILDLLTPTDNELALEWRAKCNEYRKAKNTLRSLPIGAEIKFIRNGEELYAYKHAPAYQFKKAFWMTNKGFIRPTAILNYGYEVVSQ